MFSFGAGAETRAAIGIVIFFGVIVATVLTIFIIPAAYALLARRTGSPLAVTKRLEEEMKNK
jgi:multidrug efflux pump subunit AcrB